MEYCFSHKHNPLFLVSVNKAVIKMTAFLKLLSFTIVLV
jgi:hypothetical protein